MPGLNGLEGLRLLRREAPSCPIAKLSRLTDLRTNEDALMRGTDVARSSCCLKAEGLVNKVIARRLNLAEYTVRVHVAANLAFFGANTRMEAIQAAHKPASGDEAIGLALRGGRRQAQRVGGLDPVAATHRRNARGLADRHGQRAGVVDRRAQQVTRRGQSAGRVPGRR